MCPKFQLEILTRCTIFAIHKFLKNILESLRNVGETTSRTILPGTILYMGPANEIRHTALCLMGWAHAQNDPCMDVLICWSLNCALTCLTVLSLGPYPEWCLLDEHPLLVIRCCPKLLLTLHNRTLFHHPMLLKVFLDIYCCGGESLTHHGLKMPYGYIKLGQYWFKIGSGNDLLQYSIKPLPDPVSTY